MISTLVKAVPPTYPLIGAAVSFTASITAAVTVIETVAWSQFSGFKTSQIWYVKE